MPQTITPITKKRTANSMGLLRYQSAWMKDESDLKIWEKSRRIGATWIEAADVVISRLSGKRDADYWFSSADESAAAEFADYCRYWYEKINQAVAEVTEGPIDEDAFEAKGTAFTLVFPGGQRMIAMSSNPRRFRSKGGDVGLDEFAYHDKPEAMFDAAEPCTMWGGKIRILSTHNGQGTLFHRFCDMGRRRAEGAIKPGDMPWSLHRVTLTDAVEDGLVERINETKKTSYTREGFVKMRRDRCRSEDQWLQEYMATPSTDSSAWLTYQLIEQCEADDAGLPEKFGDGQRYLGMDIGESQDRSVIYWGERVGDILWVRERIVTKGLPLSTLESMFLDRLNHPKTVRGCVDATGLGTQIGQAAERTGKGEAIKFSVPVKDELASPLRGYFEDRTVRIPVSRETRESLHAVRMTVAAGHPRFDAARTEAGHGDEFWALALMCHAAKTPAVVPRVGWL